MDYRCTLKRVRNMIKTYNQMHRSDKFSQCSSIIWPVWLNDSVFVYELNGFGFGFRCSHPNFRYFFFVASIITQLFHKVFISSKVPPSTMFWTKKWMFLENDKETSRLLWIWDLLQILQTYPFFHKW